MIKHKIGALSILTGLVAVVVGNSLAITSVAAYADVPGEHPYYLHALSDLRAARWLEQHRPGDKAVSRKEHAAIVQIEAAINDIKKAAIDDGKNLDDHPEVDVPQDDTDRLDKALEILRQARSDVLREEDNSTAVDLRTPSFRHINAAIRETRAAIFDVKNNK